METPARNPTLGVDFAAFKEDTAFQVWIGQMMKVGKLDDLLEILVQNGSAIGVTTLEQGLQHLADVSARHPFEFETARVTVSDFSGIAHTRPFLQLDRALNRPKKDLPSVMLWNIGRLTHEAVGGLWSGRYPLKEKLPIVEPAAQLDWLIKEEPRQLALFHKTSGQGILGNLLLELADCWRELAQKLRSPHWWENYAAVSHIEIERLQQFLKIVFGSALESLNQYEHGDAFARHAAFLGKMQWAAATVHAGFMGRQGIFRERLILPETYRLGSWRIDVLVVESISGSPLTEKQHAVVDRMARKKYASLSDIYHDLRTQFGPHVKIRIHEFKSSLGDNTSDPNHRIDPGDLANGPLKPHLDKVRTYVTLAELHQNLTDGNAALWGSGVFTHAGITYFWPEMLPVTYEFVMTPEEQQKVFESEIAVSFPDAIRAAAIRNRTNVLISHITNLVDPKPCLQTKLSSASGQNPDDTPLFPELNPSRRIRQVIENLRRFLDPQTRIVEILPSREGKRSEYVMHADALLRSIDANEITTGHFGEQGGNISCLMPDHNDEHPSMRVYLGRGYARCFVCEVYIPFAPSSVPAHVRTEKRTKVRKSKTEIGPDYAFEDFDVPQSHFDTMEVVQEILHQSFQRSDGEKYLREKRRIDPDLAHMNNAGFCTDTATRNVIEALGFDECLHFGLIGFSSKLYASEGLVPFLKRRGMTFEQIIRREKVNGREVTRFPYFILRNRVTFPLSFSPGKITNFYGRAVGDNCPKSARHRKLLIEYTGVPHGIFNPEALGRSKSYIPVCEGITDALVLKSLGYDAIALIGVTNLLAFETLRRSGNNFGVALDNDPAGSEATQNMMTWFRERNYPHKVFNFTEHFLCECPEAISYDDFGTWWQQSGHEHFKIDKPYEPDALSLPLHVRA